MGTGLFRIKGWAAQSEASFSMSTSPSSARVFESYANRPVPKSILTGWKQENSLIICPAINGLHLGVEFFRFSQRHGSRS